MKLLEALGRRQVGLWGGGAHYPDRAAAVLGGSLLDQIQLRSEQLRSDPAKRHPGLDPRQPKAVD